MKNRFEQIVKLRFGLEDVIPTHPNKEEEDVEINLADYPWDKCIEDQIKAYGDKATAEKVCGAIKAGMRSQDFVIPSPESGESQDEYVSRCIKEIYNEYGDKQSAAICYSQWENK